MSASQRPDADLIELSAGDRELLASAREQLGAQVVPSAARARLLEQALAEARRSGSVVSKPAQLVPVRSRGAAQALGLALAMAAALVLFAYGRGRGPGNTSGALAGGEHSSSGEAADESRRIGARLFQSELFHAPAGAFRGVMPAAASSLFSERPFAPDSHAWQARRWNDLGAPPTEPAAYEHEGDALCMRLGSGERVVAGWPWLPASDAAAREPHPDPLPAAVPLRGGQHYRLVFKAWASEPLPEQLLVAVGHARVPFSGAGGARVEVSAEPRAFVVDIAPRHDDPSVGVAFLANAAPGSAPSRVCVGDVTLSAVR